MSNSFKDASNSDEDDAMLAAVNIATMGSSSAASGSAAPSAPVPQPAGITSIFNQMPTPAEAEELCRYMNSTGPGYHPPGENSEEDSDKCTETTDDQSKLSNSKPEGKQRGKARKEKMLARAKKHHAAQGKIWCHDTKEFRSRSFGFFDTETGEKLTMSYEETAFAMEELLNNMNRLYLIHWSVTTCGLTLLRPYLPPWVRGSFKGVMVIPVATLDCH
jgi:hypothetical protein